MKFQFGAWVRTLRENQYLFLQQVGRWLEIDPAQGSKIEKGTRQHGERNIPFLAELLHADKVDKLFTTTKDKILAFEAIHGTGEKLNFKKSKQ